MTVREDFQMAFMDALRDDEDKSGFAVDEFFPSGPMSPKTAVAWWLDNGPGLCVNFMDWYEHSGARVWTTPDGHPAVELKFEITLGSVPVRGAIDMVLDFNLKGTCNPDALCIVDLKSGTTREASPRQLAIYACALEQKYSVRPKYGTYFMARGVPSGKPPSERAYFLPPVELTGYEHSVDYLAEEFRQFDQAVDLGIFPAHPSGQCDRCGVAHGCLAVGGKDAILYDPSHPGYKGV